MELPSGDQSTLPQKSFLDSSVDGFARKPLLPRWVRLTAFLILTGTVMAVVATKPPISKKKGIISCLKQIDAANQRWASEQPPSEPTGP